MRTILTVVTLVLLFSCQNKPAKIADNHAPIQEFIERLDPAMDLLIPDESPLEILASGFTWSEGPLWLPGLNALIFSDVPENVVWKWTEADSLSEYLRPSGYQGDEKKREPGANGLALDLEGNLILCQHGFRQVARMKAPLTKPQPQFETLANVYEGKKFNSPNDLCISSQGTMYFTDPPYGLDEWSVKELEIHGVYKQDSLGVVTLLVDSLTRPNGVALSKDERTLYVAQSDPDKARYYAYDLDDAGNVVSGGILLDVTNMVKEGRKGLPDGLKVHKSGNLFATGPGGVLVISPEGKHLGTILTGQATANCAFDTDEKHIYMTADSYLMRVAL